jgi:putative phage-type endonuclease
MYKLVELTQGSDQWHAWRKGGIGSSDAPIIMGVSPYKDKTRENLLASKLSGESDTGWKYVFERGHEFESKERAYMNLMGSPESGFQPVCGERLENPFQRASLDGFNAQDKIGLEIKYVGIKDMVEEVPIHHQWQLIHEMLVFDLDSILYVRGSDNKKLLDSPLPESFEKHGVYVVQKQIVKLDTLMRDELNGAEISFLREWGKI